MSDTEPLKKVPARRYRLGDLAATSTGTKAVSEKRCYTPAQTRLLIDSILKDAGSDGSSDTASLTSRYNRQVRGEFNADEVEKRYGGLTGREGDPYRASIYKPDSKTACYVTHLTRTNLHSLLTDIVSAKPLGISRVDFWPVDGRKLGRAGSADQTTGDLSQTNSSASAARRSTSPRAPEQPTFESYKAGSETYGTSAGSENSHEPKVDPLDVAEDDSEEERHKYM